MRLKILSKADTVSITFGEWRDRTYGNTYHDALIYVNDERFESCFTLGHDPVNHCTIREVLAECGYRFHGNVHLFNYKHLANVRTIKKAYRELNK